MSNRQYKLFGFASGGGRTPQFLEPVFKKNNNLYVQSCSDRNNPNFISKFVLYYDKVDVYENESDNRDNFLGEGDERLFAMRDNCDAIIFGKRHELTKHIKLNILDFINSPYFFKSACIFASYSRPELQLLSSHKDLLETTVFSNSISKFCSIEYETNSLETLNQYTNLNSNYKHLVFFNNSESKQKKSVFRRWLDFAQIDSKKLVTKSKWKHIDKCYESMFETKSEATADSTFIYYLTAKKIISEIGLDKKILYISTVSSDQQSLEKTISQFSNKLLLEYKDNLKLETDHFLFANLKRRESKRNVLSKAVAKKIYRALFTQKTSLIDLTRVVYFISIVLTELDFIVNRNSLLDNKKVNRLIHRSEDNSSS